MTQPKGPEYAPTQRADGSPTWLDPSKVGAAVVACPGCGEERWYGYGSCGSCGTHLPSEKRPALCQKEHPSGWLCTRPANHEGACE